jgi:hypothetical protein
MAGPAKVPSWIDIGQIVCGIGGLLIFIGFIFGYLAMTNFPTSATNQGNLSNYQGDFEGFFIITAFGLLLAVGGWLMHSIWPKFQARPRPAPAVYAPPAPAPMAAPAPEAMAQAPPPPAPAPVAAPAAPLCPKCGKPTTYIAQYGRYYCYTDGLYV